MSAMEANRLAEVCTCVCVCVRACVRACVRVGGMYVGVVRVSGVRVGAC